MPPMVTAEYEPSGKPLRLAVETDANQTDCVFILDGETLTLERASKRLLKPLFLPEEARADEEERQKALQAAASSSAIPQA
jgi:hypothetical protein